MHNIYSNFQSIPTNSREFIVVVLFCFVFGYLNLWNIDIGHHLHTCTWCDVQTEKKETTKMVLKKRTDEPNSDVNDLRSSQHAIIIIICARVLLLLFCFRFWFYINACFISNQNSFKLSIIKSTIKNLMFRKRIQRDK